MELSPISAFPMESCHSQDPWRAILTRRYHSVRPHRGWECEVDCTDELQSMQARGRLVNEIMMVVLTLDMLIDAD